MAIRAIKIVEVGKAAVAEVPKPELRDGYVLVKVKAVGLNPTDWKSIDRGEVVVGARSGCDYAGVVEEVGNNLGRPFKKGDRIAGFVHGAHTEKHDSGSFGEYVIAKADIALKIPDNISDEQAATLGVSVTTVGQGLYLALKLPLPTHPLKEPEPLLIYGGSTATGIFGIQYAKLSGLSVAATASKHNHEYLKSLGADAVFDYKSPSCADDIKAWASGQGKKLRKAWDCIASDASAAICAAALSDDEEGGIYAALLPVEHDKLLAVNPKVKESLFTLGYDAFGESYSFGKERPGRAAELEHGRMFWGLARDLLEQGKLKTIKPSVNRGGSGLEGVLEGLADLKEGKVTGEKLVYTL
ncbi:hypothetical protein JX265_007899 [Neoarthrinium moseri]|uniref:Enoyl reductase (ER) domain-containing protein n=1 Tax=Neoarthrinium moseri TaxID=1658444 RepID=A0A9P9WIM4_9PEZI|nr:uncharacterized protein JN550_006553 [Neoarthrinium moseri]KAI1841339.1 hypothetical protein JX266_012493 [Neoarthrinium moseri]KAI1865576.1 hypothetical protein JX265_007899 [Neoarthrinium moseri]KAI1868065.1 hypothetical protein JN550_006553 [Neoarthrinium moseri]